MLYLSADEVRQALPMRDAIDAMRQAFVQLSSGQVSLPVRQRLDAEEGAALVMSCYSCAQKLFAVKFLTGFEANRRRGLPNIQARVMLADGTTGRFLAMMDGGALTAIRTGAASGVATDLLAPAWASVVAIFGSGVQARTQLEAVCSVRKIDRAFVFDIDLASAERYATDMAAALRIPVEVAGSPQQALANADVVCTATPATSPLFDAADLKPGTHINAVGAFTPAMVEIPPATVCRARVVVDHVESILEEAGDLLGPLRGGLIEEAHFGTELGRILIEPALRRNAEDDLTLFKSVGVAIQDLCAAARAVENAARIGIGSQLN